MSIQKTGKRRWALKWLRRNRTSDFESASTKIQTVTERQAQLIEFYRRFEELTDLLVQASQYGPDEACEIRYQQLREWLLRNYVLIRKFVSIYLASETGELGQSTEIFGRTTDELEMLLSAPTVASYLQSDAGHAMSRFLRTRAALNSYSEHLKTLVA